MRIATMNGRLALVSPEGRWVDVEKAGDGAFSSNPLDAFTRWSEFGRWASGVSFADARKVSIDDLGPSVPHPRQVFAIGLNYRDHAEQAGLAIPTEPLVFTKWVSSLTGPRATIPLPSHTVDWETELVAVIGTGGRRIDEGTAWDHIAGLTLGQDISDRTTQNNVSPPQFGLGKSYEGFSPVGPLVVTVDEFGCPDDIEIGCSLNGKTMQCARTKDMIFSIPRLVARLSVIVELLPGDLIFTGTPGGTGTRQNPPRFLRHGDELTSWCPDIGDMRHRFVEAEKAVQ